MTIGSTSSVKCVVVSQSMFFPWIGMLEQIRLADIFVHYDDVKFSKGSFSNRVQLKNHTGISWMTVPLDGLKSSQKINEVSVKPHDAWAVSHLNKIKENLQESPFLADAMFLYQSVVKRSFDNLGELAKASMLQLAEYFEISTGTEFIDIGHLNIKGSGSERVLSVVNALGGSTYITGKGALNYLDHELFEQSGVEVKYMNYQQKPYPQLHGEFTPYVTALDLVANCGKEGARFIQSESLHWKDYKKEEYGKS